MFFMYKRGCKSYVNSCRDWTLAIPVGWWESVLVSHFGLVWTTWAVRRRDMSCLDVLQSFRLVWTIWTGRWRSRSVWTYCKRSFLGNDPIFRFVWATWTGPWRGRFPWTVRSAFGIMATPDGPTPTENPYTVKYANGVFNKTSLNFRSVRATWTDGFRRYALFIHNKKRGETPNIDGC